MFKFKHGRLDGKQGGLSIASLRKHSIVFRQTFAKALLEEYVNYNPARDVPLPKKLEKKNYNFLSCDEVEEFLACFDGHFLKPLVEFTLFYGLRKSEVVGLKWDAVDFKTKEIEIKHVVVKNVTTEEKDRTKTNSSRRKLFMSPEIEKMLLSIKEQQEENKKLFKSDYQNKGYVFTWPDGRFYQPDYITRAFRKQLEKHSFKKLRFHDLRHSTASILFEKGCSLKEVQTLLGHADIGTTADIYTHVTKKHSEEVVKAMSGVFEIGV